MTTSRVIVALDFPAADAALAFAASVSPADCRLKIGKELFTAAGPVLVETLSKQGFDIFLDLKFHDIPNTVAGGIRAVVELAPTFITIHAGGGREMMKAAVEEAGAQAAMMAPTELLARQHYATIAPLAPPTPPPGQVPAPQMNSRSTGVR